MKRLLIVSFIYFFTLSVSGQKVTVQVVRNAKAGAVEWMITDSQNNDIFTGSEKKTGDTISFSLEANNYYFLKIRISEVIKPYTGLLSLCLNGEPILFIESDRGNSDQLIPFFTGIRTSGTKIVGGSSASISEFPWQVYFISGDFRCGGSIIGGKWVLTAAHCTKNSRGEAIPASDMFVKVGANNPANPLEGKTYEVSEAFVHERYDNQTLLNDIALLKLKDSINYENALPIKLVNNEDVNQGAIVPGVMSWVTGWGYTHVNPNLVPGSLQKVQLPIISNEQASLVWNSLPSTVLMAGYFNGNKDACKGDSGGPLVVPVLGDFKLAGIVSWGSYNCSTYGAYTRVSDYESWIRSKTGIAKDFKPSAPTGELTTCQGTESSQYSVHPVSGAGSYEWRLLPASAGIISGNSSAASVLWNPGYSGPVTVALRVVVNNKVSDWSRFDAQVVLNTKLMTQTSDTVICAGQPVILSVNSEGHNLYYRWYKNEASIQSGTSPDLVISNSSTASSGDYKCEITGNCGTVLSGKIKLTVYPETKITGVSAGSAIPFGGDKTLEVNSEGHQLVYQWQKDGISIDNSNTSRMVITQMNATHIGIYKVIVEGTCGTDISDTIYLYVKRKDFSKDPEVFLWPTVNDGEFRIAISNDSYYNIRIYSGMGKKMMEFSKCRYDTSVDISYAIKGIYIVEVYNDSFRKSIKVLKN